MKTLDRRFPIRLLGPIAVSAGATLLVPGIATGAWIVFAAGIAVRLASLARRTEPAPSRFWMAASVSTASAATLWAAVAAHDGRPAGPTLLSVLLALGGFAVAAPATSSTVVRLVGLSLLEIGASALLAPGLAMSALCLLYVAVLVSVLLRLATAAVGSAGTEPGVAVRRVTAPRAGHRPRLGAALRLLAVSVPLGLWFFVALPHRAASTRGGGGEVPTSARTDTDDALRAGSAAAAHESALDAFVSGGKTSLSLGFVSRVKRSQRPVLLATVDEGVRGDEPLTLRGRAYDVFTGDEWTRSTARSRPASAVPDALGWVALSSPARSARRHRLTIEDVAGEDRAHLFLAPDAVRVRLDPRVADRRVATASDGIAFALGRLPAGGIYEEEAELPPDRIEAIGRRSDASVAPDSHDVEAPPEVSRYRAIALRVVEGRTGAAERAERIEDWLRTTFAYTTEMPPVRKDRPVLDFLERLQRGHCEYFASSMALLLRSLGLATRVAVGFKGGDWLESMNRWSFRGNHAHAWCEVWYEGLGWMPYDPTPAAEPLDGRTGAVEGSDDGDSFWERLARLTADDRRRLVGAATGALGALSTAVGRALSHAWPWSLASLALAAGIAMLRRRTRARGLGEVDARGHPLGPYGAALALLARAALRRGPSEAAREFAGRVTRTRSDLAPAFDRLTFLHDRARFGASAPTAADVDEARASLASLRRIAVQRSVAPPAPTAS